MSIFRINKNNNYTCIDNEIFRNKKISLKAKGLLATMLSKPNDWDFSEKGLAEVLKETIYQLKPTLKELEDNGYLLRTRNRNDKGQVKDIIYDIYEKPICENPTLVKTYIGKNLHRENPTLVNHTQVNNNNIYNNILELNNNNILNNNIYNVEKLDNIPYKEIIDYMNQRYGTNYKTTTTKTRDLIKARINEGFNVEDFKIVIDKMGCEWMGTDMQKYLRPETLFGNKFESYLNRNVKMTTKNIELSEEDYKEILG